MHQCLFVFDGAMGAPLPTKRQPREPIRGANVVKLPPTVHDSVRVISLMKGSPFDSVRRALSRSVDEDLLGGRLGGCFGGLGSVGGGGGAGAFDELAVAELGAGADEGDQVGALTARQRAWAAWMSLNAMASPDARDPGPLVTLVRCLTVLKVDSMGLVVRKWI